MTFKSPAEREAAMAALKSKGTGLMGTRMPSGSKLEGNLYLDPLKSFKIPKMKMPSMNRMRGIEQVRKKLPSLTFYGQKT